MVFRQLILVPLLLRFWGAEYYGSWLVLNAIPSVLAMSNLGLGTSAALSIAFNISSEKKEEAVRTTGIALAAIAILGTVVTSITYFAMMAFSLAGPHATIALPELVVACNLAGLFVRLLSQPLAGWWTGAGQPAAANHYANLNAIGELLLSIVIPALGGKALALSEVILLWNVVWFVFFVVSTTRKFSFGLSIDVMGGSDFAPAWRLLKAGLGHQMSPLWQAILFQGSLVLANNLFGPSGAALWGSLRVVTRSGNQLIELISQSMGPEFQIAHAKSDERKVRQLHSVGMVGSIAVSALVGCALLLVGPQLFAFWTRRAFSVPFAAWIAMSLGLVVYAVWWMSGEYQRSINRPWFLNGWAVVAASLAVGVMWLLGRMDGICGFAFGSVIFDIAMVILVLPQSLRLMNDSLLPSFERGLMELRVRGLGINRLAVKCR